MAIITVKHSGVPDEQYQLSRLRTTIGRSARSDVCIPDAFASRLHAEIRKEGDNFWLHDLGSANGTRLNGTPVSSTLPLYSGNEIQIGETKITFESEVQSQPSISATFIADATS